MGDHVFISYSRKDQTYARKLADDLRRHSVEVWIDDRIDYGDRWWRTIVQAIRASAAFVVVMTPDSEESEWVEREVQLALRERKPIFPLLLRGKEFPLLITTHYADVTDGRMPPQDFYDRLEQVLPALGVSEEEKERAAPAYLPFEPEMVLIPAGHFVMGTSPQQFEAFLAKDKFLERKWFESEMPHHTVYLPDYHIAETPVTNSQYAAFLQATAREQPRDWRKDGKPPRGKRDYPVVWVSWHDALAYCRWLSEVTGKRYRLPSEAEWEKAARGTDGRIYPWGNQWDAKRCNIASESGGGQGKVISVGAYPEGASPYGVLDMAGNVREWTRSLWGMGTEEPDSKYPYDPTDGRENLGASDDVYRVTRGGSWDTWWIGVRCGSRSMRLPTDPDDRLGFRVVMSAS
jgi:formylglycine-generating enzyme required for sulfatase activity